MFCFWLALAWLPDPREKIILDVGDRVKMEFVIIRPGTFQMGSDDGEPWERPAHLVTLTKDYWIQTTETTQAQWESVMRSNPSPFKGKNLPVERVSWEDAKEFVKNLNEKLREQLEGRRAALPTEAEWEYACRAGGNGRWHFGDDDARLGEYAWFHGNANHLTHPVGRKKPNPWGLYDMHGNVWEWCEDWFAEGYRGEKAVDPQGPSRGASRVLRGGAWAAFMTRSSSRARAEPTCRAEFIGLRPVLR